MCKSPSDVTVPVYTAGSPDSGVHIAFTASHRLSLMYMSEVALIHHFLLLQDPRTAACTSPSTPATAPPWWTCRTGTASAGKSPPTPARCVCIGAFASWVAPIVPLPLSYYWPSTSAALRRPALASCQCLFSRVARLVFCLSWRRGLWNTGRHTPRWAQSKQIPAFSFQRAPYDCLVEDDRIRHMP